MSQLDLAHKAEVSARHLGFVEVGRSKPSRDLVLRLGEHLEVPLRQQNALLLAAGFAPAFHERSLDDPAMAGAREAIERILAGHEPYPAVVVDNHWNIKLSNRVATFMNSTLAPELLRPPVNALRLTLHPGGMAPAVVNFAEWRGHLLERLRHQIDATGDAVLVELLAELHAYPAPAGREEHEAAGAESLEAPSSDGVLVPLIVESPLGRLNLISTTMVFGTPRDVTLSELALESFFPADAATAQRLAQIAAMAG